jgi:hypothetical protein
MFATWHAACVAGSKGEHNKESVVDMHTLAPVLATLVVIILGKRWF